MCVTCWMIIQRLAERLFWREIGDFSVWGAYDLSDHEAMSGKEHEHSAAKFSSEILQKVHLLIWKPPRLPYSKVNVAVIRDLNVNFVAVKAEVIVGQCCLEAHFAGFWHALQLFNQQGIQEVQLESHL
ncbi:hypothetical protein CMV_027903, partial [Castanea mollissima]